MAKCPRCAVRVPAHTRCDGCGLVLGFEGITVLMEFEDSPQFERARRIASREESYSEWTEENGCRFVRVTYSPAELGHLRLMAAAAATVSRKHTFLNGLEIRWPVAHDWDLLRPQFAIPVPASPHSNGRASSSSH